MAARTNPLRSIKPGEKPAAKQAKAKTVTQAAKGGTARELLCAMRDRIAESVENPNTPARDLAALTKRLMETVREIEAILSASLRYQRSIKAAMRAVSVIVA